MRALSLSRDLPFLADVLGTGRDTAADCGLRLTHRTEDLASQKKKKKKEEEEEEEKKKEKEKKEKKVILLNGWRSASGLHA